MAGVPISRRAVLRFLGLGVAALGARGFPAIAGGDGGHVVVVGGGFGGATAARYIRRFDPSIRVTLVEPRARFYTCPFSNLYLAGLRSFDKLGHGYDALRRIHGVDVVPAWVEDVDTVARHVRLRDGSRLAYDRLLLSPGVDMDWQALEGYDAAASEHAPHAWKAGSQSHRLRRQLEAMDDGGVFILSAPANPYRCPPGPYERVSLIAHFLKRHKPRSKILLLDAKDGFSKQPLFMEGWQALYGGMIEWVGLSADGRVLRVDARRREVETEFGARHRAAVLNVVPPQKAGLIAHRAGVTDRSGWVPVKPETFESRQVDNVYVVGDATVAAPMPKSAFCANSQARMAAAAIVASLQNRAPPEPVWANTCYSLLAPEYGISVAGVYRLIDGEIAEVPNSGGISPLEAGSDFRAREARYAQRWYASICDDTWGPRG